MTNEQLIHIGMLNSFNVITERNTFEEIMESELSMFAHVPDEIPQYEVLVLMVEYFASFEMFEHCIELKDYINLNYHKDGTPKQIGCECPQPVIKSYSRKMYCGACNKRLKR